MLWCIEGPAGDCSIPVTGYRAWMVREDAGSSYSNLDVLCPKQILQLVQGSIAVVYLMNAMLAQATLVAVLSDM